MDVSSSTVRNELAELEALGLLTHPHTSAGRVPTESGYRLYAEELVDTLDGRPEKLPLEIAEMRNELESGAAVHHGDALAGDAAPRARLGAGDRFCLRAPRRRAAAAAARGHRRRDHVHRAVSQSACSSSKIPPTRASSSGRARISREQLIGLGLGSSTLRRRLEDPALPHVNGTFLGRLRPAFVDAVGDDGPQLSSAAAGLLGDARGAELEACQRLLDVLERRAAVLELLSDALDPRRTVVRVGPEVEGAQLHDVSYVGASYGLASRSLGSVALLGPLRMDYEKAIRTVRAAAFELSRLVEDVYEGI